MTRSRARSELGPESRRLIRPTGPDIQRVEPGAIPGLPSPFSEGATMKRAQQQTDFVMLAIALVIVGTLTVIGFATVVVWVVG